MIPDEEVLDRVIAIFLNEDSVLTHGGLRAVYKRRFGNTADELDRIGSVVFRATKSSVLVEHDIENDSLDGILVDHNEHGQLSNSDITFIGADDLLALGPKSSGFVHNRASELAGAALSGGLVDASTHLKNLPIDSSRWTGLPNGIKFDDKAKAHIVNLLHKADSELSSLKLSNRDTSQARALINAAIEITNTPEPEYDILVRIMKRIGAVLGVSSSVATLLTFVGLVK